VTINNHELKVGRYRTFENDVIFDTDIDIRLGYVSHAQAQTGRSQNANDQNNERAESDFTMTNEENLNN